MLVKVAIDLALDRLFTYTVPEELEKKLTVKAHGITAGAKEKIEAAGGKAEVI